MSTVKTKTYWSGQLDKCDICNADLTKQKHFIEGRTVQGFWCIMCRDCHSCFGVGIEIGRGQVYLVENKMKVAG